MRRVSSHPSRMGGSMSFKMRLFQLLRPVIWLVIGVAAMVVVSGIGFHHMAHPLPHRLADKHDQFLYQLMHRFNESGVNDFAAELSDMWIEGFVSGDRDQLSLRLLQVQMNMDFVTIQAVNYTTVNTMKAVEVQISDDDQVDLTLLAEPVVSVGGSKTLLEGPTLFFPSFAYFVTHLKSASKFEDMVLWIEFNERLTTPVLKQLKSAQYLGAIGIVLMEGKRWAYARSLTQMARRRRVVDNQSIPIVSLSRHQYWRLVDNVPHIVNLTLHSSLRRYPTTLKMHTNMHKVVRQDHVLSYINGYMSPRDYVLVTNMNRSANEIELWAKETATVLEMARMFSEMAVKMNWRPHRTIVFSISCPLLLPKQHRTLKVVNPHVSFLRSKTIAQLSIELSDISRPGASESAEQHEEPMVIAPSGRLEASASAHGACEHGLEHVFKLLDTQYMRGNHVNPDVIVQLRPPETGCSTTDVYMKYVSHHDTALAGYILSYHIEYFASSVILPVNISRYFSHLRSDFDRTIYPWLINEGQMTEVVDDVRRALRQLATIGHVYQAEADKIARGNDEPSFHQIIALEAANDRLSDVHRILNDINRRDCGQAAAIQCGPDTCFPRLIKLLRGLRRQSRHRQSESLLIDVITECHRLVDVAEAAIISLKL